MGFDKYYTNELERWPEHCSRCAYLSKLNSTELYCGYSTYSGRIRILEPENADVNDCTHWKEEVEIAIDDPYTLESLAGVSQRKSDYATGNAKEKSLARKAYEIRQSRSSEKKREREKKMLELYDAGKSDEEIAKELNCTRMNITRWRTDRKLPSKALMARQAQEALRQELYDKGWKDADIAAQCGCTVKAIMSWRGYRGYASNK